MKRKALNFVRIIGLLGLLAVFLQGLRLLSFAHQDAVPEAYMGEAGNSALPLVFFVLTIYVLMPFYQAGVIRLSGYRLHRMQLPFLEICRMGRVKLRPNGSIRPFMHAVPPRTDGTSPYRLYVLSMPLLFLLLGGFTALLTALVWHTAAARSMLPMPFACFFTFALVLFPRRSGDPLTALLEFRNQELLRAWECSLHISAALDEGLELTDMPDEWFPAEPPVRTDNRYVQVLAVNCASRLIRQQQYDQAYGIMRPLYDLRPAPDTHQVIACAILNGTLCEALAELPPMCMSQLDHQSVQYMTPGSWKPRLLAAKFARALFLSHDEDEASSLLRELEAACAPDDHTRTIIRLLQEKAGAASTSQEE